MRIQDKMLMSCYHMKRTRETWHIHTKQAKQNIVTHSINHSNNMSRKSSMSSSTNKKNARKQVRFSETVSTNDAAAVTKKVLAQEAMLYSTVNQKAGKEMFWNSSSDFDDFSRYNKDLVAYAKSAGPVTEKDWTQLEYALNIHGHSLRGLERIQGMPGSSKRDDKKEMAIYGVLEALKVYAGDDNQISMIAKRLSSYSVKKALELGDLDELAVICFPAEHEMLDRVSKEEEYDEFDDEVDETGRPIKKTRRRSKGSMRKDILNALKNSLRSSIRQQ